MIVPFTDFEDGATPFAKCLGLIELSQLLTVLEQPVPLIYYVLTKLSDYVVLLDYEACISLVTIAFQYESESVHDILAHHIKSVSVSHAKQYEWTISDLIDSHYEEDHLDLYGKYIEGESTLSIQRMESYSTMGVDMNNYTKTKEYCRLRFQFEEEESKFLYEPSIIWSQCAPLRKYLDNLDPNGPLVIPMSSLELVHEVSQDSWNSIINYYHNHELVPIDMESDICTLYEFFVLRNGQIMTEEISDIEIQEHQEKETLTCSVIVKDSTNQSSSLKNSDSSVGPITVSTYPKRLSLTGNSLKNSKEDEKPLPKRRPIFKKPTMDDSNALKSLSRHFLGPDINHLKFIDTTLTDCLIAGKVSHNNILRLLDQFVSSRRSEFDLDQIVFICQHIPFMFEGCKRMYTHPDASIKIKAVMKTFIKRVARHSEGLRS